MTDIGGMPYFALRFNDSTLLDAKDEKAVLDFAKANPERGIACVSHGWRNSPEDAQALYQELFGRVARRLKALGEDPTKTAIFGVFWPSMALPEFNEPPENESSGGAVALDAPKADSGKLRSRIVELGQSFGFPEAANDAARLIDDLENKGSARTRFVELLKKSAPASSDASDDASDLFFKMDPEELFQAFRAPVRARGPRHDDDIGGAQSVGDVGGATGILDWAGDTLGAAFRIVNYLTYYQMKERAGKVGASLNVTLKRLRDAGSKHPIHLVGHSFGARLVTAAASLGVDIAPSSVTLLQGAFSHNGFAAKSEWDGGEDGFFRALMAQKRLHGPLIATHTANDRAVGFLYPLASRLSGANASAIGDANDQYGGIGRNGALHLTQGEVAAEQLLRSASESYAFELGRVHNLLADTYIKDHGDVRGEEVANVIAQVIQAKVAG